MNLTEKLFIIYQITVLSAGWGLGVVGHIRLPQVDFLPLGQQEIEVFVWDKNKVKVSSCV